MLRTKRTFLSSILVSPLAFSRVAAGRNAEPPQAGGGASEIDAAKFPSLQAALDAVPEAGGVVRLPPGRVQADPSPGPVPRAHPADGVRRRHPAAERERIGRACDPHPPSEPGFRHQRPALGHPARGLPDQRQPEERRRTLHRRGERDRAPLSDDRAPWRTRHSPLRRLRKPASAAT